MKPPRRHNMLMSAAAFLLLATGMAFSIAPTRSEACFMRSPQPVQVWLDHIHVDIVNQVAEKTYNCTFRNPNPSTIMGATCYMELEPGAQVDNMSVVVDGKETKAEILDTEKANKVFTEMVAQGGSPALLEYYGNQLIQTRVPRIAANGTVTVKLKYTTVLKQKGGLVRLQMLNTNPKALMQPLKSASVSVNIRSDTPIKNVYSPTHEIALVEKPEWDIAAEWKQENYLPTHPFVLYYQLSEEDISASLLAHREVDEEGAFLLMLSPTMGKGAGQVKQDQILPKDIVFCVDTSGSMLQGNKMEQAREALNHCVRNLRPGDRFNIVDFGTTSRNFSSKGLVHFNDDAKVRALQYVKKLHARGGTAIQEALTVSLDQFDHDDRMKMIVFATDGLPTIGERNPEAILKEIAEKNRKDVRIFVFGEGFNVNTRLLDFLALDHRGESEYILPDEDISTRIASFFDRVGSPLMTDLRLEIDGLEISEVFPRKISDVYKGEQVVIYGRYTGHGTKTVRLSGQVDGETRTFEYEMNFPEYSEDERSAFVPRLWAGQKVDFLLNEIRKSEMEDKELIEEVTYLAKRYGIVTPYTSFLLVDDVCNIPREQQVAGFRSRLNGAGGLKAQSYGTASVVNARLQSMNRAQMVNSGAAGNLYWQANQALRQEGKSGEALSQIRYVGNRTFYNSNNVWIDSRFEVAEKKNIQQVDVGSKEYFKLLKEDPSLARSMAQGNVVVQSRGRWLQFNVRGGS